ncbi:hypothetical protein DQ384_38970 [Sphaerisporangium album]|uniref:Alpha/beta hydrolase n=1 Tax=Sphaerisporangium album TaxID=509200 RepID=A0A367ELW8_9ACTN|nr:hypothetical protein [Sphaerisporangium album]RCG18682.1 hypothetical protein DQ384_38970 [Sphaerisporangium album]
MSATVHPRAWGDLPTVVIAAGGHPAPALDRYRSLAALSTGGRLVVVKSPEHYVQYAEPRLVLDAVREVLEARAGGPGRRPS